MNVNPMRNAINRGQQKTYLLLTGFLFVFAAAGIRVTAQARAQTAEAQTATTTSYSVGIKQLKFTHDVLTIHPGEKVQWKNSDIVPHTVTAEKVFNSGSIAVGGTWTLQAPSKRGEYIYTCTFHPNMKAKLIVQ